MEKTMFEATIQETSYRTADQVNSAMLRVYNHMLMAIVTSAVVAGLVASSPAAMAFFFTGVMKWITLFLPLVAIFGVSYALANNPPHPVAVGLLHGFAGIMGKTSYRGYVGRYSFYLEGNNLHAFFQPDINYIVTTPVAPYLDNKFHNLVMTIDRTSMMYFYIDGVSVGTPVNVGSTSAINLNSSTDNFYIGSYGSNNGQSPQYFLNGNISQASVYNRALTAAEVLQNYNALRPRF